MELQGEERWGRSESLGRATNNQAELWAVGLALDLINSRAPNLRVEVRTDSQYVLKHLTARVQSGTLNKDQIHALRDRLASLEPRVSFYWVRGLANIAGNEWVDREASARSGRKIVPCPPERRASSTPPGAIAGDPTGKSDGAAHKG